MNTKNSRVIGVDVGGTKILLQSFDEKFNLIEEEKVFTEVKKLQKGFTDQLISLIGRHFHSRIKSLGVALPGIVDHKKGLLVEAPHLPVKNLQLKKILEKKFKKPVYLDHDLNAFLFIQAKNLSVKKYKNILAVMVGTGVGGALMMDGNLFYGSQGFAGEVGHMILNEGHPLKTFEQNTAGFFIPQIAKNLGIKSKFTPVQLAENSLASEKVSAHLVKFLGLGLSNLNLIFNPEAIVLGGSIYEHFLTSKKSELQKNIAQHALNHKSPPILDSNKLYTPAMGVAMMSLR